MFLGAIAYVARTVGDEALMWVALLLGAAVLGFLVFNFPRGLLFLGDGGAYLIGFLIAELALMLVHRNSEVSPWFALTLLGYPIVETIFSMYRKRVLRGRSPGQPDGLHLHMLIHKRLVRRYGTGVAAQDRVWSNALTSPFLWVLALVGVVPAALFWDRTEALQGAMLAFVALYVWLYWRIVRFRAPRALGVRRAMARSALHTAHTAHE
jgi:UDP-GlcNAc:undecaprenyl-phosphate GlcNAc-1-phosphate transferase